jgi:hypothetical protein
VLLVPWVLVASLSFQENERYSYTEKMKFMMIIPSLLVFHFSQSSKFFFGMFTYQQQPKTIRSSSNGVSAKQRIVIAPTKFFSLRRVQTRKISSFLMPKGTKLT